MHVTTTPLYYSYAGKTFVYIFVCGKFNEEYDYNKKKKKTETKLKM